MLANTAGSAFQPHKKIREQARSVKICWIEIGFVGYHSSNYKSHRPSPWHRGLAVARELGADYLIFGEIEELSMKRFLLVRNALTPEQREKLKGVVHRHMREQFRRPDGGRGHSGTNAFQRGDWQHQQ